MKLSEAQVIKHLSKGFSREAMHYHVATEKSMSPECTVHEWLDAIRDFFFTNGHFRMHIEGAWSKTVLERPPASMIWCITSAHITN